MSGVRYFTGGWAVYEVAGHAARKIGVTPDTKFKKLDTWYRADECALQDGWLVFLWPDGSETSTTTRVVKREKIAEEPTNIDEGEPEEDPFAADDLA